MCYAIPKGLRLGLPGTEHTYSPVHCPVQRPESTFYGDLPRLAYSYVHVHTCAKLYASFSFEESLEKAVVHLLGFTLTIQ